MANPKEARILLWLTVVPLAIRFLLACQPQPSVIPSNPPDASDSGILLNCAGACNTLKFYGCREGTLPDCEATLNAVVDNKLIRKPNGYPLACSDIALARSTAEIRELGASCNGHF